MRRNNRKRECGEHNEKSQLEIPWSRPGDQLGGSEGGGGLIVRSYHGEEVEGHARV